MDTCRDLGSVRGRYRGSHTSCLSSRPVKSDVGRDGQREHIGDGGNRGGGRLSGRVSRRSGWAAPGPPRPASRIPWLTHDRGRGCRRARCTSTWAPLRVRSAERRVGDETHVHGDAPGPPEKPPGRRPASQRTDGCPSRVPEPRRGKRGPRRREPSGRRHRWEEKWTPSVDGVPTPLGFWI